MNKLPYDRLAAFSLGVMTTVLAVAPANAQSVPLSPVLANHYARLGALQMVTESVRRGKPDNACIAAQHLQQLEGMGAPVSAHEASLTQQIINNRCASPAAYQF